MANFCVKTKNEATIDKKPRVYFTCHPDDFEKHFSKICEDIFKTHDCAIYYTADMTEVIPEDERELDLGRQNLFVVPVTFKLLSRPNRAMDEDIPYALQNRIPVLPIMMEPELDTFYSKPDKFGELQYLKPGNPDLTEIPYEEKLRKHLDSVLISDELAQRVRAAFDAYIFLSYRKKDRVYANELMRLIHKNPECRDIAIWFDEFLTPGESFKENIEKMLDNSELFTLLVTPQLLEKVIDEQGVERDNYVVSTELPLARKKNETDGTDIFAVEMESTDRNALSAINIMDYVNIKDEAFRSRLLETIHKAATTKDHTPEHNYLIGLAYLDGIDVEVDRERGWNLVTDAAEAGLLEAMVLLHDMCCTNRNYELVNRWAQKIYDYCVEQYGEDHHETILARGNLALSYRDLKEYPQALEHGEQAYLMSREILGEEHPDSVAALNNLAGIYVDLENYDKAAECGKKAWDLSSGSLDEESPVYIIILQNLAEIHKKAHKYSDAVMYGEQACDVSYRILGEEHPDYIRTRKFMATLYWELGNYTKAVKHGEKWYSSSCKVLGKEHPDAIAILGNLAQWYDSLGNYNKAVEYGEEARDLGYKNIGIEHPVCVTVLGTLALTYSHLGNHRKAVKLGEKACRYMGRNLGNEHPNHIGALSLLAGFYEDLGDYRTACDLRDVVYCLYCNTLEADDPVIVLAEQMRDATRRALEEHIKASKIPSKLHSKKKR